MIACPLPLDRYPQILLAHGGGGKLMGQLLKEVFEAAFGPGAGHDAAVISPPDGALAFTTDSYVVHPLIFPGGDIGALSVYGTVNDLAMAGARPLCLSAGFILEEGLSVATLWQIVQSMQSAAQICGVKILTGDTKVVERGKGDGVFINTAGIGSVPRGLRIHPDQVEAGDRVLISGDLGRHGIALLAAREGLELETPLESDLAPLHRLVADLLQAGITPHCLRDLTRGGLASALNEIAETGGVKIAIEAETISVCEAVDGACELLGLDPLYVANEGRCLVIVSPQESEKALEILHSHHPQAARVGVVTGRSEQKRGLVTVNRGGVSRLLDLLSGEQLPRIC
ncbi:MAG: hydrogenase expression/formation protein HypE [Cyanobacteriota bacterium]|nr:hydrogenase expression/formation protein HypE [Cyanobacteriota bacterium]